MWQFEKVGLRIDLNYKPDLALSLVQGRTGTEQHQGAKQKARNPEAGPAED